MDFLDLLITEYPWLALGWFAFIGACVGSFLNVVVYRVPNSLSLMRPGSHCPNCKHPIRFWHNIPVLGWIILRGRCKDCRQKIPVRYPAVELFTGLMWGIFFYVTVTATVARAIAANAVAPVMDVAQFGRVMVLMAFMLSLAGSILIATSLIFYDKWTARKLDRESRS